MKAATTDISVMLAAEPSQRRPQVVRIRIPMQNCVADAIGGVDLRASVDDVV